MRRYGQSRLRRIGTAAALRALGVLVRRHPAAAIDALGAGVREAARIAPGELRAWLASHGRAARGPRRPTSRELRRLRRLLDEDARRADAGEAPPVRSASPAPGRP